MPARMERIDVLRYLKEKLFDISEQFEKILTDDELSGVKR